MQQFQKPATVTVAVVQTRCAASKQANVATGVARIAEAAASGAQIVCLPELFAHLYFCQTEEHRHFDQAEPVPGPTSEALAAAARRHGVVVITSVFERRAPGLYHNTAVVIDADGQLVGKYRKMHIPDDPLYYEKFYFTPGDLGFKVFATRYARVGVLICWDQWYPEAARLTALRGADILFYPTAIGWHPKEKEAYGAAQHASWEIIQRSHGIANGCYVVSVNRTGHEGDPDGGIEFWGQSFVSDPGGTILAKAAVDQPEILVVPIDLARIDEQRTHWPFLRDRRIDAYGEITRRYIDEE